MPGPSQSLPFIFLGKHCPFLHVCRACDTTIHPEAKKSKILQRVRCKYSWPSCTLQEFIPGCRERLLQLSEDTNIFSKKKIHQTLSRANTCKQPMRAEVNRKMSHYQTSAAAQMALALALTSKLMSISTANDTAAVQDRGAGNSLCQH